MKSNYKKLAPYIRLVDIRNTSDERYDLLGVSVDKHFIKSIANTIGTDWRTYKVIQKGQFCYIPDTSRRGDKMGIALLTDYDIALVSQAYTVFEIINQEQLLPEYLNLWFKRPEFDRYARFHSHGSVREIFDWEEMCNVELPVPEIEEQRKIVEAYNTIERRIALKRKINDNLSQMLGLIYEQWFYRFEFPNAQNLPYKQANGELEWSEKLKRYIPKGWKVQSMMSNDLFSVISSGVERFTSKKYYATADITGSSIGDGCDVEYETRESRANMQPVLNSVWFAKMKNSVKHLFLNKEMTPFIESSILSTGFYGLKCSEISFEYAASVVSAPIFESTKDRLSHGATQQGIGDDDLANMPLLVPNDTSLSKFHEATKGLYSQISNNILENKRLIAIRNFLLPLLMNGQATIAE